MSKPSKAIVLLSSRMGEETAVKKVHHRTIKLHNGVEMPTMSLGTAHVVLPSKPDPDAPQGFSGFQPERTYRQMELALQSGLRTFDTALNYRTETMVGRVLGEWWTSGKLLARSDVWITSKIYNCRRNDVVFKLTRLLEPASKTPQQIAEESEIFFEQSLMNLGVGYIDLMLLHWPSQPGEGAPELNRQLRLAAWRVLETMYKRGWCRAIGVSNYSVTHLEQLVEDGATIVPMVNQIEASVEVQHLEIREYCKKKGIVPQAFSVMRGLDKTPDVLIELGTKYNKDIGQIAYRYLIQHGYSVVFLTNSESRMVSNTQVFDFELTQDEMTLIDSLNDTENGGWGLPKPNDCD
mmetsp:Transcript_17710/g.22933  ORF Transcript_17710/g.22933 Transcript_17710/m.22933 type:complete len:350 (+) Transcript_17710:39-1088(+)